MDDHNHEVHVMVECSHEHRREFTGVASVVLVIGPEEDGEVVVQAMWDGVKPNYIAPTITTLLSVALERMKELPADLRNDVDLEVIEAIRNLQAELYG
ncbi:MAG: hypothetical protein Q8R28_15250 [Dehalococcoidia bacterium]|nr:hypothetical protein [Dehalococcoidia bacterium]